MSNATTASISYSDALRAYTARQGQDWDDLEVDEKCDFADDFAAILTEEEKVRFLAHDPDSPVYALLNGPISPIPPWHITTAEAVVEALIRGLFHNGEDKE